MRVYVPATLTILAAAQAAGVLPADPEVVVSDGESEEDEYSALMTAADVSAQRVAGLAPGLRRRVVVVAEVTEAADPHDPVSLADVVAIHADPHDDADPEDDLAWYASQELPDLTSQVV